MVLSRLPGIFFNETVESMNTITLAKDPLFMFRTEKSIPEIEGKINRYKYEDFKKIIGAELPLTLEFIRNFLDECNTKYFYTYAVTKTATIDDYRTAAQQLIIHPEIDDNVYFFEETKTGELEKGIPGITSIAKAFRTQLVSNAHEGTTSIIYLVPRGTIDDAVKNRGEKTAEQAITDTYTSINTAEMQSGRICLYMADETAPIMAGHTLLTPYNEDVGYTGFNTPITTLTYNFNYEQMLLLQNSGVMFIRPETSQGKLVYRINLGVTSNIASVENLSDSFLIHRRIADMLLDDIKVVAERFLKAKESQDHLAQLQVEIDALIKRYNDNEDIDADHTSLKCSMSESAPYTWLITGKIKPISCVGVIEVNTILS